MLETSTQTRDDYALMEAIAAGDEAALACLYDRHAGLAFTLCFRILRDRMASEDLLMDVFWELWSKADRYDCTRGSPRTYLLTLARSRAIDRRRSMTKRRAIQIDTDLTSVDEGRRPSGGPGDASFSVGPLTDTLARELGDRVRRAMSKLEPSQRQAVELSFFDDLSHSQIAERLGKPLGTVKTNIRMGLIHLRQSFRKD